MKRISLMMIIACGTMMACGEPDDEVRPSQTNVVTVQLADTAWNDTTINY